MLVWIKKHVTRVGQSFDVVIMSKSDDLKSMIGNGYLVHMKGKWSYASDLCVDANLTNLSVSQSTCTLNFTAL